MSHELKDLFKFNLETTVIKRLEVFDLLGRTDFTVTAGTFTLRKRSDATVLLTGVCVVNNADTDLAGNAISTVTFTMVLDETDASVLLGDHYLNINIELSTGQTDEFRYPVEVVDFNTKRIE